MAYVPPPSPGAGRSLPGELLFLCSCCTIFTVVCSTYSVWLQLKHYYKPFLQRYVVRIMILCVAPDQATLVLSCIHNIATFVAACRDDRLGAGFVRGVHSLTGVRDILFFQSAG